MAQYPELDGRLVLVTGAGRGIGRGIALAFAEQGARVLVNDLTEEHGRETVEAIRAAGAVSDAAPADVADRAAVRAMVAAAVERYGEIDVLVNNAGINVVSPFLELTDEVWERTQRIHHWGFFYCAQEVAGRMAARGGGSIVVISSPAAVETYEGQTHYAAAKAGLQMLAFGLAWELGGSGVRTNLVSPGWIETELNREYLWSEPDLRERVVRQIPLGRTGNPEDVARAVVWLCTDEAAYVNGAVLRVDGGLLVGRLKA
jgi:NAD(P)-dependent dehydrogenase (short-subunit alcohol dehydrogenase family)